MEDWKKGNLAMAHMSTNPYARGGNHNGLTDEQIAGRPEPFVGMLVYCPPEEKINGYWEVCVDVNQVDEVRRFGRFILLPGEKGCPWPPPPEFQHEWKEGDKAWVRIKNVWFIATVTTEEDGFRWFAGDYISIEFSKDTPAIYIPEGEL